MALKEGGVGLSQAVADAIYPVLAAAATAVSMTRGSKLPDHALVSDAVDRMLLALAESMTIENSKQRGAN